MILIRSETVTDYAAIRKMHLHAFGEDSPGALVDDLRHSKDAVFSFVCEHSKDIAGHVLFSRLDAPFRALTMAPVGVHPKFQKMGIGSSLIQKGLECAKQDHWQIVFVLGDPAYYERFGFSAATAKSYISPYKGPANMALILDTEIPQIGVIKFPPAFDEDIAQHSAKNG